MSVSEEEITRLLGPLKKAASAKKPQTRKIPAQMSDDQTVQQVAPTAQAKMTEKQSQTTPGGGGSDPLSLLYFDRDDMVRGIIYATVLGKPRSKSGRRW